eukprot:TRINITY_DN348_c0_g2_i10.p2 TRINITY_DN348_c0_g2~~TRINITY_DN348_c0_g2_i10.p2  ORF type:complete len:195 (-),score=61.83 TRINITY_DN348_c0_g2_i10:1-585(-)
MGVQNWMNNKGAGKVARTPLGGNTAAAGKGGFVKSTPVASSSFAAGKGGCSAGKAAASTASASAGKGSWSSGGNKGSWSSGNSGGSDAADAVALVALASMLQGAGGGSWGYQKKFRVDKSGGELGEFIGTIKSFSLRNNYGFIECPDIAAKGFGDIFLHGDHKKGYKPGQTVKFSCVVSKEGKAVALDLKSGLK